jgi:HAMP domain-containing protein
VLNLVAGALALGRLADRPDAPSPRELSTPCSTPDGQLVAVHRATEPRGVRAPSDEAIAEAAGGRQARGLLSVWRPLLRGGDLAGWLVCGVWLDDTAARRCLPHGSRCSTTAPWSATAPRSATMALWVVLVAWSVAALLFTSVLLHRLVAAPVRRAVAVAHTVASGDLEQRLEPTGPHALRAPADARNDTSAELDRRLRQLAESRDQPRGALSHLAETLSSSRNLDRTLAVRRLAAGACGHAVTAA